MATVVSAPRIISAASSAYASSSRPTSSVGTLVFVPAAGGGVSVLPVFVADTGSIAYMVGGVNYSGEVFGLTVDGCGGAALCDYGAEFLDPDANIGVTFDCPTSAFGRWAGELGFAGTAHKEACRGAQL
ncbi:hypothetical protein [Mycobacterium lepromatosis]|uniref:hypothetical protein n=1 Tax=Mycobacterium lepromatosis TaxID=480418 RepID=UPI0005F88952|nr:hypothetical protein [Mycobacterium lepromatosis]UKN42885.1 hypothetical protein MLPF_2786 [Mycobacterium lepromatosis]